MCKLVHKSVYEKKNSISAQKIIISKKNKKVLNSFIFIVNFTLNLINGLERERSEFK